MTTQADALRAAADLLDAHPDLPPVSVIAYPHTDCVEVCWYLTIGARPLAEQRETAARIVRTAHGRWDRQDLGTVGMRWVSERGPVKLTVLVERDAVCERVVTGTETVTVPAVEAQPERVETRDVVEWRCLPLLGEAAS